MMDFADFRQRFSLQLNRQQEAAVRKTEGPVLLLAVPGSGKTTALLSRVGNLLYCHAVPPENILTVTYTVAATNDLRRRFAQMFGTEYADRLEFRTINGMCARIIRQYEQLTGRQAFQLVSDDGESLRLLREAWKLCGRGFPTENDLEEGRTRIAYCKNAMLTDEEIRAGEEGESFFQLFEAYRQLLLDNRRMDYDDQMVYGLKILRSQPQLLRAWQDKYRYIHVDEAQDTSKIQHTIIGLLASRDKNLFMVGDEDQSIYGFRAAWPQALTDFEKNWPGASVLYLETNYRSTGAIVAAADGFIRQNTHRHPKRMTTPNPNGQPISRHWVSRRWSQYTYLAQQAALGGQLAVLYRNHESALPLMDLLDKQGTPYTCRGQKASFFTHPTVRDVVDIFLFSTRQDDADLFLRLYYKFHCGISRELAQRAVQQGRRSPGKPLLALAAALADEDWLRQRIESLYAHLSLLPGDTSAQALGRISEDMGYREHLRTKRADEGKLDILMAIARNNPHQEGFLQRLEQLETLARDGRGEAGGVVLSTIHGSKGLEYDRVILMDVADGLLPQNIDPFTEEGERQLEEERRLFYVAMTRAKNHLEVLSCRSLSSSFASQLFPEEKTSETRAVPKPSRKLLPKTDPERFTVGVLVRHKTFGRGLLCSRDGDIALIRFDSGEQKRIALHTAIRAGILRIED